MSGPQLFERPRAGERAVLVQLALGTPLTADAVEEFRLLAEAAGAVVVGSLSGSRATPEPRLFIGSGKADELATLVVASEAELVIFDHALSPAQERNLERRLNCRVVDRAGLILDIFAQRARSFEGKLQVELAQLRHLSTRLVRGWTHLERQKGGIGLRGPGETQLETDRRLLGRRIALLNERLTRIEGQQAQVRRARLKAATPTVSLVGYTNAGKSTLFNRLTAAGVFAADQLFATLDPTLRRLSLPGHPAATGAAAAVPAPDLTPDPTPDADATPDPHPGPIRVPTTGAARPGTGPTLVLADTVGFINQLPHELVAAFRSTLIEARSAQLLLHVVDASAAERDRRIADVDGVLAEIGAEAIPRILVFNKLDRLPGQTPRVDRDADGRVVRVWLSAVTGAGVDLLLAALAERFRGALVRGRFVLAPGDGALYAWLRAHGRLLAESHTEAGGWDLWVELPRTDLDRLLADERFRHCPPLAIDADAGEPKDAGADEAGSDHRPTGIAEPLPVEPLEA